MMLYPYYVILWGGFAGTYTLERCVGGGRNGLGNEGEQWLTWCNTGSMYMMGRMVLGHKTWFGKG